MDRRHSTLAIGSDNQAQSGSISLIFSSNSLRNATYNCDSAGIHYRVSTPTGLVMKPTTSIYRWDRHTNEEILVAEWEQNWTTDRMRILTRADMPKDFLSVKDVIKRHWSFSFATRRTFVGENGRNYVWKQTTSALKLYHAEDESGTPVAQFHRPNYIFNKHDAYLELQPEALEILDTLILTFLYAERKRRDEEKAANSGG